MNKYVRKLISFLLLDIRTRELEVVIGYLESIKDKDYKNWQAVINAVINFDRTINYLLSKDIVEDKIKAYGYIFNNLYSFMKDEDAPISFIELAPFINQRVANVKDYNTYTLARETRLNEYKNDKGDSKK